MHSRAIVRPPGSTFGEGLTSVRLGVPDFKRALAQHEAYCAALQQCGLRLTRLEPDEEYPDSTFLEDTAVITERGAVLTRPGAATRIGEVAGVREVLQQFYSQLHSIDEPGTIDGGDVCEADEEFFIGISQRTNLAGASQLARVLKSFGYPSTFVDIRDVQGILHLKSGLGYLGDNRLAAIDVLVEREEFRDYDLVRVNTGQEYAANCLRVNGWVLVAAGYPAFEETLRRLGYQTIALEMAEFQKMDGGLSCLSLRF